MSFKKATSIYLDEGFCLAVCKIYDFYDFGLEAWTDRVRQHGKTWRRGPVNQFHEDDLIEENAVIRDLRRQLGYAVTTMLCSELEGALIIASRYLGVATKRDLLNKYGQRNRRPNVLEASLSLFGQKFHVDFASDIAIPQAEPRPLPGNLTLDINAISIKSVEGLIVARNAIVHELGEIKASDAQRSGIPILPHDGSLSGEDDDGFSDQVVFGRKPRVEISKEYIERVTQHSIGLVAYMVSLLRSRQAI